MSHTLSPQNPVVTVPRRDEQRPCDFKSIGRLSGNISFECTQAATNVVVLLCPHGHMYSLDACMSHVQAYLADGATCRPCRAQESGFGPRCCFAEVQAVS